MKTQLTRREFLRLSSAAALSAALSACGANPKPTPAPTNTQLPIATTSPTATVTPMATSTPIPTATTIPTATRTPISTATATPAVPTLRALAEKIGLQIGVCFGHTYVPGMMDTYKREFNLAVIGYGIDWAQVEEERGNVKFTNPKKYVYTDEYVDFAIKNNMDLKGDHLFFQEQYPQWLLKGNFSREDLIQLMKARITFVMTYFKGKIKQWSVVNEAHPVRWGRDDLLMRVVGEEYVDIAFQTAREVDPSAILIYNDANNHSLNTNIDDGKVTYNTQTIVQRLKSKGLIDGVGLHMHMKGAVYPPKDDVIAAMRSYRIPVYVTEFDVNLKDVPGTQDERFARQAQIYKEMLEAALESGVCKSFAVWNIGDKYSWIETTPSYIHYSTKGDPTPFDDNLKPKPAYFAMLEVLQRFAK